MDKEKVKPPVKQNVNPLEANLRVLARMIARDLLTKQTLSHNNNQPPTAAKDGIDDDGRN